jgi:phosphoserine phosphatase RsbU/P
MACAPRGITVLTACDDATKARVYDKAALIVDDSRTQRLLFTKKLESWGYSTQEAVSGRAALDLCATQHFDLILSDWIMPEMDGLEFCRAFRALRQDAYTYFIRAMLEFG